MKRAKSVRYTIILAIIGIAISLLVLYVNRNTRVTYEQNLRYISLTDHVQAKTVKAYLWSEELMSGTHQIEFEKDVVPLLTSSRNILQGAYDGTQTELGNFNSADEETQALLKETILGIESLTTSTQERWSFNKQSYSQDSAAMVARAATSVQLKEKVDASYNALQISIDKLTDRVNKKLQADASFLKVLSWGLAVIVFGIFVTLCFIMFTLLRGNEKQLRDGTKKLADETNRVEKLSSFIESVSTGNYAIEIDSTDELSNKLIQMRDTLRNNAEEDQRRNWATSGLAQIGEILRSSDNTRELYDNIIKFVVKYVKSNQGGLFLVNDDNEQDPYLELVACYAFERKKFIQKRVEFGYGLVGQCYLEGARIHLLKIPDDYVHITSGLGGTNPNSLLVIPMKVNEKTYGVIELASFRTYEEHEIVLVEKFAENIAAAVSSVKINESTRILLEKTQQQAEEMRSQEEEMRQNMEELSATQEEMLRKEREYINRIHELEERSSVSSHT